TTRRTLRPKRKRPSLQSGSSRSAKRPLRLPPPPSRRLQNPPQMLASPTNFEKALRETLSRIRLEAVEALCGEVNPAIREEHWHTVRAIDRLTERLGSEFRTIIERAAREPGDG